MASVFEKRSVGSSLAHRMIAAAEEKAAAMGHPFVVAIIDESGVLKALSRMDGAALLSVQDAGTGVKREEMDRLFQAFYTTKPEGMGMGLAISRSIVEAHGGRLWATPNDGPGATFAFTVPVWPPDARP